MNRTSVGASAAILIALFLCSGCSNPIVDSPICFQIAGTVFWSQTREPVPDAIVSVRVYGASDVVKASGVTSADGFYSLSFMAYGNCLFIQVEVKNRHWIYYWKIKETGDPQTIDLLLEN